MKKNVFLLCVMMVAMMAASVGLTSCSKDDDGGVAGAMTGDIVGTWVCDEAIVTLNADGTCSGSGVVINGNGNFSVKTGNFLKDDYHAVFTFMQNGKTVRTATLVSYTNDHKRGWVKLSGYEGETFIFDKQ